MTKERMLAVTLILVFSAMLISSCTREPTTVQVGLPAPKFKLKDLSGQEISLDQFKGRVVMLDFWATTCGPCRMTMPMIENLQKEFTNSMVLLAINLQEPKDVVKDYVWHQNIHSQVLLDEEGSAFASYGGEAIPLEVVIDKEGIVRYMQAGFGPQTLSQLRALIGNLR